MSKRDDKRDDTLSEQCMVNPSEFDYKKYAKLIRAHEREELLDIVYGYANHLRNDEAFQAAIKLR